MLIERVQVGALALLILSLGCSEAGSGSTPDAGDAAPAEDKGLSDAGADIVDVPVVPDESAPEDLPGPPVGTLRA